MVSDLSGLKLISWVFAIYTLTTSVTTPIYGNLADLFGRKKVFIFGVILFVVGSMLSGAAQTMNQLIWFRAFQGIGAGAVMPLTFTIIGDLFPGAWNRQLFISYLLFPSSLLCCSVISKPK
nr:MFS transporter [Neobacillus sp. MER 74]